MRSGEQLPLDKRKTPAAQVRASDITRLLKEKHRADFFISQVKNGPSMGGAGYVILDGWAMKKSWANPLTIGYEIKVSRQDFLKDRKWHNYLDYCNEFYFVTLNGIIALDELPKEAGLMTVASTGKLLITKKKSVYRDVPIPEEFYRHILMSKMEADELKGESPAEFWKRWLETKEFNSAMGHRVSCAIARGLIERQSNLDYQNERLRQENQSLQEVKEFCERNSIEYKSWWYKDRLKSLVAQTDPKFLKHLDETIASLGKMREQLVTEVGG